MPAPSAETDFGSLCTAAAAPYRVRGRFAEGMARGKMSSDPAYRRIVRELASWQGTVPVVLDVGCGEGYLLALAGVVLPDAKLIGVDHDPRRLDVGRAALGDEVTWIAGDLRDVPLPSADVVTCVDVLHYLPPPAQDAGLARLSALLRPSGLLIVRDAEADAGWRSRVTACAERALVAWGRHRGAGVHLRTRSDLRGALQACGLSADAESCRDGTPFANVLYVARLPPAGDKAS